MLLTLFILIVSLALLVKGSDVVVDEVVSLASFLRVSPFLIGLTVVAVGTSFPELATNVFSALEGAPQIGVGNIIGSNLYNLGFNMALGFFLLIAPFQKRFFQNDAVFLFVVTSLFLILSLDGSLTFFEGFAFLFIFGCYFLYLMKKSPRFLAQELQQYAHERQARFLNLSFLLNLTYLALGLVALILGARYLISSVLVLSSQLGLSEKLISLTLVSFGTALPELFVTINATRKGLADVFLGNIVGSNIANILLILGLASLITPLPLTAFDLFFGLPMMLFMTLLLVHFLLSKRTSQFFTGFLLFLCYGLFLLSLVFFANVL